MFDMFIMLIGLGWLMLQGVFLLIGGVFIMCLGLSLIEGFFHLMGWILGFKEGE